MKSKKVGKVHLEGGGEGGRDGVLGGLGLAQAGKHALQHMVARPVAGRQRLAVYIHRTLRPHSLPDRAAAVVHAVAAKRAQQRRPCRVAAQPSALQQRTDSTLSLTAPNCRIARLSCPA